MMPGNYSRSLFDPDNEQHILSFINDLDRRDKLADLLAKLRCMRKVYRANDPKAQYPEDTKAYNVR
jgi:hypothetical protein